MSNRRHARRTDGFSKTFRGHMAMMHLWMLHYNFCRARMTLKTTPTVEAGIDDEVRDVAWISGLIEANAPKPKKPGPRNRKQTKRG